MNVRLTIDKAGRVVIPKPLREHLKLTPGDTLELETEGDRITLRPIHPTASLRKELGVWVYHSEPVNTSIPDLIEQEREKRIQEWTR